MDLTLLSAFVVACLILSLVPGPDMLYIVANSVVGGRRAGVVAAAGISNGIAVHTVLAALGLGALVQAAPVALDIVRWTGALFLIYLAISTWRSSRREASTELSAVRQKSIRKVYLLAVLTNLANPKVILFYLAFFPQFLTVGTDAWSPTVQFLLLGLTLIVVGFCVDASVGLLAGTVAAGVLRRQVVRRWMDRVCAAIFGGLAVRLILDNR